jgi:hypothetical protein
MNTADSLAKAAGLDYDHKNRPAAGPAVPFDPSVAHPTRVYGYWLGGNGHYEADRKAAEDVARLPAPPGSP